MNEEFWILYTLWPKKLASLEGMLRFSFLFITFLVGTLIRV